MRDRTYQSNHLDSTLLKLILHLGKSTQLGGANGCEISRVGEKDGPTIANELMEVNLALRGQCLEVRRFNS